MHHCYLPTGSLRGQMAAGHGCIGQCFTACLHKNVPGLPQEEEPNEWTLIVAMRGRRLARGPGVPPVRLPSPRTESEHMTTPVTGGGAKVPTPEGQQQPSNAWSSMPWTCSSPPWPIAASWACSSASRWCPPPPTSPATTLPALTITFPPVDKDAEPTQRAAPLVPRDAPSMMHLLHRMGEALRGVLTERERAGNDISGWRHRCGR